MSISCHTATGATWVQIRADLIDNVMIQKQAKPVLNKSDLSPSIKVPVNRRFAVKKRYKNWAVR